MSHLHRLHQTHGVARLIAENAVELADMRRKHREHRQILQQIRTRGQTVEGVGIDHHLPLMHLQKSVKRAESHLVCAQSVPRPIAE